MIKKRENKVKLDNINTVIQWNGKARTEYLKKPILSAALATMIS